MTKLDQYFKDLTPAKEAQMNAELAEINHQIVNELQFDDQLSSQIRGNPVYITTFATIWGCSGFDMLTALLYNRF